MTDFPLLDTAGGSTDKGPVRQANEDSFLLPDGDSPIHHGYIYIVADGVGGQKNGAEASQLAVRIIHDRFYQSREKGKDIPTALQDAAEEANLAIYDASLGRGTGRMGCTVVAVVHHENQRTILHAGDARVYLLRNEELHQLTRDDTWVQMQIEEGLISEDTAANHKLRHVITRVLGNKPTLEATISESMPIKSADLLLLCSDGLYDVISSETIQQTLFWNTPQAAAKMLVNLAIEAPAKDNITAVVIESIQETKQEQPALETPVIETPIFEVETETAVTPVRQPRIKLRIWLIVGIVLTVLLATTLREGAWWQQFKKSEEPIPTITVPTTNPLNEDSANLNPACVVSLGGPVYVWQDDQIQNNDCDQFAREGFELKDGDQVNIIDPTPIIILGPDETFCQENQFIKVQSIIDNKIEGWVLMGSIQLTTQEKGCRALEQQ